MEWYQILITLGSVITAGTLVYKFVTSWGVKLAEFITKAGVKSLRKEDLERNENFKTVLENQTNIATSVGRLAQALELNTMMTLRLEIKDLIRNSPEQRRAIEAAIIDYHNIHGDSYVDAMYEEWKEEFLKKQAKKEIKHKGGK